MDDDIDDDMSGDDTEASREVSFEEHPPPRTETDPARAAAAAIGSRGLTEVASSLLKSVPNTEAVCRITLSR